MGRCKLVLEAFLLNRIIQSNATIHGSLMHSEFICYDKAARLILCTGRELRCSDVSDGYATVLLWVNSYHKNDEYDVGIG